MNRKEYKMVNKKPSKKRLILKTSLILVVSLLISLTVYGVYLAKKAEQAANNAYESDTRVKSDLREAKVEPITDNVSILFIGIDDSEDRHQGAEHSRSDSLMLATLNNKNKTVKLVSIPRDSYVYIPKVGYKDKITHAHAFGGTQATIDTVEKLLDVPVDYYFRLNFKAFIDIVDALGGIEAEVPYKLLELDENDSYSVNLEPGMQHLNGREALALARTRKKDSDVERGKRQQMILEAILKEATSVSSFTKYANLLDAIGNNMKTNMRFDEMKSFFEYAKGGAPQVESLSLDGVDDWTAHGYYWQLNEKSLKETREILKNQLELTNSSSKLTQDPSQTDTMDKNKSKQTNQSNQINQSKQTNNTKDQNSVNQKSNKDQNSTSQNQTTQSNNR